MFHIVKSHPFVDGDKRTGLGCCLVFLELNGIQINKGKEELYDLTIKVASSEYSKENIAEDLQSLSH